MLSWTPPSWIRGRACDVPECGRESSAENCMVSLPVIGRTLDQPLRLFFCDDHKDVGSLVERYRDFMSQSRQLSQAGASTPAPSP